MAHVNSGQPSPSRFFGFRWAYVLLATILWAFFLPLIWTQTDHQAYWNPTYLLLNLLSEVGLDVPWMRLHGVFGFSLYDFSYRSMGISDYWVDPMLAATLITTVLLVGSAVAFIIPERGRAKNLPATRGIHLRGKLATVLVLGISLTALAAGFLDLVDIDLRPMFGDLGWLPPINTWRYGSNTLTYFPFEGVSKPVSWVSTLAGVFIFGAFTWLLITFVRPGRDRYWHAERWTLIFTLFGLALILFGILGMRSGYFYLDIELFLGGCYTTFIIGVFTLTWAWTCRTALFMMMKRYEKAAVDSDEPACFACGYDLRMLASDKCPECGTAVHPEVLIKIQEAITTHAESRSTTR